jgi:nucleotide-binding universal stress UspA family protein
MTTSPFGCRSILCGVDFSRHSADALRYAADLARLRRARLSVVFVVDPLLSAAAAAAYDRRVMSSTAKQDLERFVRKTLGPDASPGIQLVVAMGKPAQTILATAARIGADLVVVGTHGLTGFRRLFFGSTTEAILRRSTLPVLAVPRPPRRPPDVRSKRRAAPATAKASTGPDTVTRRAPTSPGASRRRTRRAQASS